MFFTLNIYLLNFYFILEYLYYVINSLTSKQSEKLGASMQAERYIILSSYHNIRLSIYIYF